MSAIGGSKSEITQQNHRIRERVYGRMKDQGITNAVIAKRLGISIRTFQRRMERPEEMSLEEMRKLAWAMGWKHDTAGEVYFG